MGINCKMLNLNGNTKGISPFTYRAVTYLVSFIPFFRVSLFLFCDFIGFMSFIHFTCNDSYCLFLCLRALISNFLF